MTGTKPPHYYLAIIGDIQQSRAISDRAQFQKRFHQTMDMLNSRFGAFIVSPFTVTLGDEFQALLKKADPIFEIKRAISRQLLPVDIFLALGIGEVETEIFSHTSIGMDGPCFRLARDQIEQSKKKPPRLRFAVQNMVNDHLNALSRLMEILTDKRTDHQKQIVELYTRLKNQSEVAKQLNITQAAVSQALRGAYYYEIIESENAIIQFLNQFLYN